MNRNLAIAEWHRAYQSLRAGELLLQGGYFADAISRAYYAVLHAAKAALHVHDVAGDSHAAVRRLFGLHLVRAGRIEREWSAHIAEGLDDRLAADYDAEASFSEEAARDECRRSREFLDRIFRYLLMNGLTESELQLEARNG